MNSTLKNILIGSAILAAVVLVIAVGSPSVLARVAVVAVIRTIIGAIRSR